MCEVFNAACGMYNLLLLNHALLEDCKKNTESWENQCLDQPSSIISEAANSRLGNFTSETVNTACEFVITELTYLLSKRYESCGPYPKKNKYI